MSIVIFDDTLDVDGIENIERILDKAFDGHMPSLVAEHGMDVMMKAGYRIRVEVILDGTE
jgi:hypothetical protein